jgi:hypothetical protein
VTVWSSPSANWLLNPFGNFGSHSSWLARHHIVNIAGK